jgi:membrane protein implicated in regulation of membrane protease activity
LDIFYVVALLLGGGYSLLSVLMGGVSHVAGHLGNIGGDAMGHIGHVGGDAMGHVGHVGHGDAMGHVGHVGPGHTPGAAGHHGHVDLGHHGHHADSAHHGSDQGDSGDSEDSAGRINLLAYLSPTLLAGLLLGVGTGGVASRMAGAQPAPSLAFAGAGGLLLWGSAYLIVTKLFGGSQASSHVQRDAVVGMPARVVVPIAGSKPGMISLVLAGTHQTLRAISDDGQPIAAGTDVRVRRIVGGTATVTRSSLGHWLDPSPTAESERLEGESRDQAAEQRNEL